MSGALRARFRDLVPPAAVRWLNHHVRRRGYFGRHLRWEDARAASSGYDHPAILERVRHAADEVRAGRAAFDRDGSVFPEREPPLPLLYALLRIAGSDGGHLSVLDFGGGLGSSYRQCLPYLEGALPDGLSWSVVEQRHFVECGRRDFESEALHFHETVDECLEARKPNALLLSGVLQYLESPHQRLAELMAPHRRFRGIVVDRTPVADVVEDRLTVQRIDPAAYGAAVSYPAWIFSEGHLTAKLRGGDYDLLTTFDALDGADTHEHALVRYRGYVLIRRAA